jgi:hypothetical protein
MEVSVNNPAARRLDVQVDAFTKDVWVVDYDTQKLMPYEAWHDAWKARFRDAGNPAE